MADDEMEYTEDDIDAMKLPKAKALARDCFDSDFLKSLRNIQDIKCELKKHLLKNRRRRSEVIKTLAKSKSYHGVCMELQNIFSSAKRLLDNNEVLRQFLEKCFGSQFDTFSSELKNLTDGFVECPILVLGQTGAGKSSFINLLLGEDILPTSTLSNTNTICEIRNSTGDIEIGAKFFPKTDTELETQVKCKDLNELRTLLQERIQKRDTDDDLQISSNTARHQGYKKVQIYIPCDILKETGLQIVDSPGIADTEEMTDVVHGYLSNAVAFIYIINSQDAGGIAPERLQELFRVVVKISLGDIVDYRPNCAIFVCNKWDQIPIAERKKVYDNTVEKLSSEKSGWPFFDKSSLFCLSSNEASKIQRSEEKWIVGSYGKLVEEIGSFIRQLLARALANLREQEEESSMDTIERQDQRKRILSQVKELQKSVKSFAANQESMMKKEIENIASNLCEYLLDKSLMEPIFTEALGATRKEIPWKKNTIEIKKFLVAQIGLKINEWNSNNSRIKKLGESLDFEFRGKFPEFDTRLLRILVNETSEMDKMRMETGRAADMTKDCRKGSKKEKAGLRSITGASLVSATVRLPLSALKGIVNIAEEKKMEIDYSKATNDEKKVILKKFAERAYISQVKIAKVIEVLQDQISVVVEFYKKHKNKIMNEIKANKEFYKHEREPITEATPKRKEVQSLLDRLIVFEKITLPDDLYLEDDDVEYNDDGQNLSNGIFSSVGLIKVNKPGALECGVTFYIRKQRFSVQPDDILSYIKEEAFALIGGRDFKAKATKFLRHRSIDHEVFMYPLFSVVDHIEMISMRTFLKTETFQNPCLAVRDIADGLGFLDETNLVHIDLSMDTVLVMVTKNGGIIKLMNFHSPKELQFPRENEQSISKYAHFHPSLLCGENRWRMYSHKHDMYSLGILVLELFKSDTIANIIGDEIAKANDLPSLGRLMRKELESREKFQVFSPEIKDAIQACCNSKVEKIDSASMFLERDMCLIQHEHS